MSFFNKRGKSNREGSGLALVPPVKPLRGVLGPKPFEPKPAVKEPNFYRKMGSMFGWYEWDESCDADSEYFRYQWVPADGPKPRGEAGRIDWDYSATEGTQKRFRALLDAGVLSRRVAADLEFAYWCRINLFFVGGDEAVRKELMEAVIATRPDLNPVRFSDEPLPEDYDEPADWCNIDHWAFPESELKSRNDVLVYDGGTPNQIVRGFLMRQSIHHIVVAGFSSATNLQMMKFRFPHVNNARTNDFKSYIIRLGDVEDTSGGTFSGVVEVRKYHDYYNESELDEPMWERVQKVPGKFVKLYSTKVY